MKQFNLLFASLIFCTLSCESLSESHLEKIPLIPIAKTTLPTGGHFYIKPGIGIDFNKEDSTIAPVIRALKTAWKSSTNLSLDDKKSISTIRFIEDKTLANEAYSLEIEAKSILIISSTNEGYFRGIKTLEQILLFQSAKETESIPFTLPTGVISDKARFSYRGSMLDVSRHFFSVEDIKRYIDLMAFYKMNYLHLHLSDDQGWRIEIKSWPNLTLHGGSTEVGGGEGGFYPQKNYREIVASAAENFITIVPEIDIPGHTNAALSSYPELNCDGVAPPLYTGMDVGFSSLCVDKEITFKFMEDVIKEIATITPGPYFHIGGDESHSTKKEDYRIFIDRAQQIVQNNGKITMGWDEIQSTTLLPNTIAQYWHSAENAQNAVKQGAKIVMSPGSRAYLDMKYDSLSPLGLKWAGYIDVKHGYDWDPATIVNGITEKDILGIEAPLWSETIEDFDDLSFLAFPRLLGYAEIGWADNHQREWEDYKSRLAEHGVLLEELKINYYPSPKISWKTK